MVVRRFNYVKFTIFIIIVITIIIGIVIGVKSIINYYDYKESFDYKYSLIGYSQDEVDLLKNKLNDEELNNLLTRKYDKNIISLISEKYFIFNRLDEYLEYKSKHRKYDYGKVVSIINSKANIDWLEEERESDLSKNELVLVNRLYGLNSEYEPEDIISIPAEYAYAGKMISSSILDRIIALIDDAREVGYSFIISDGYRSYKEQEKLYNNYVKNYGMIEADDIVARPGHSEYQTGLTFDLMPFNKIYDKPKESEEYKYLKENAYKYGFIFRLPSDKEELTGFNSSTWKLRYVGSEAATLMYNENLCFEEYYGYFVDKN